MFGSSSRATRPPTENRQARTRLFAEDGTAVTGSFPQRQSGHGSSVMKGAPNEHPYHQGNLPFAQTDGPGTGPSDVDREVPDQPDVSPTSETDSGESALRWFENALSNTSVYQPPAPAPTPASDTSNPRQNIPGGPGTRPSSYQTCRSQALGRTSPWWVGRYGRSALDRCSLLPTYSAIPTDSNETDVRDIQDRETSFWEALSERVRAVLCCCCQPREPPPDSGAATNTTTQDTYVTAREQTFNESQQDSPTDDSAVNPIS
ncbi:hypothetical protein BDV18DRAFT_134765 [Aspergillus unguis]